MLGQDLSPVQISDMVEAKRYLEALMPPSPLLFMEPLHRFLGHRVGLKADSLLPTGAFKLRGAYYKLCTLVKAHGKGLRVITASSGNHGMAVAYAAKLLGVEAKIVVPVITPGVKKEMIQAFGAEVVIHGPTCDESFTEACRIAEDEGRTYVHPVADRQVLGGQGTISLELLAQYPELEHLVVPLGGAGLIVGIAYAMKQLKPSVRITGVMPKGSNVYEACRMAGKPVTIQAPETIADAVIKKAPEPYLLPYLDAYVDEICSVEEESLYRAVAAAALYGRLVLEPSGALGLAAILEGKVRPTDRMVLVCSGSNIDAALLRQCLEKGPGEFTANRTGEEEAG